MKKIFKFILIITTILVFSGCNKNEENGLKIITPSGTPLFILGDLLESEDIEVVANPQILQTALANNELDIIICPITMGISSYNSGNENYLLSTVITCNNSYLISRKENEISSLELELNGITSFNEKNTPGLLTMQYANKISDKIKLSFENNVNLVTQAFLANKAKYVIVSEPQLSKIESQVNINIIDISSELEIKFAPQAAIFVKKGIEKTNKYNEFIKKIKENYNLLNNDCIGYVEKIKKIDNDFFNSLEKDILVKAITRANVCFYEAKENKSEIELFIKQLDKYNNLYNGKMPDEKFYI